MKIATLGASERATLHPSKALYMNFSNTSKKASRRRTRFSWAKFFSGTFSWPAELALAELLMASKKVYSY